MIDAFFDDPDETERVLAEVYRLRTVTSDLLSMCLRLRNLIWQHVNHETQAAVEMHAFAEAENDARELLAKLKGGAS